jgi:thymidylate synthase (FAD)
MGDDLRVANVARVSFDKWKEEFDQKDAKLIHYLAAHEHNSPFRHVQVSVRCSAPVFLARQLGKHQVGLSWNEVSRRYVDVDIELYVPDVWRSRPDGSVKQGSGDKIVEQLSWDGGEPIHTAYKDYICAGVNLYDRMIDDGVAPEMARMVLPQSMMVSWVWTGSLESFYHIWRLRSGEGAQEEAKYFATLVDQVVEPLFPNCWKALKGEPCDSEVPK